MKKIAFCFLIYDEINHEELWNMFFQDIDTNKYTIYIHYKFNKPLKYFEKYKLTNCIETAYFHISCVKAQNVMFQEAMKDVENKHFILISQACIPLKTFQHVYDSLNEDYSYFNINPKPIISIHRPEYALNFIDEKYLQKAAQWCILNRKHTDLMLTKTEYIEWFSHSPNISPDEWCYITNIYINNLQNEIIATHNLADGATTFTNWVGMDYKYISEYGLKNYSTISDEELNFLLNSKCFFGRKFRVEGLDNRISHIFKKKEPIKMINPNYTIVKDGNITIVNDFFIPDFAETIYTRTNDIPSDWWYRSIRPCNEKFELCNERDTEQLVSDPIFCDKEKYTLSVFEQGGFAYSFRRTIDDHYGNCFCVLCKTCSLIRSKEIIDEFTRILGTTVTEVNEMFASKYEKGDFLTTHADKGNGGYAFTYQLTKDWNPSFGGLLQFWDSETCQITKSIMPKFNSLTFFKITGVQSEHLVSRVNVSKKRFAFSGWVQ
jgi:hypothetical protein